MLERLTIFLILLFSLKCNSQNSRPELEISQANGLKVIVVQKDFPLLKILLPKQPNSDRGIEVEFPEHVTGFNETTNNIEHLYLTTNRNNTNRKIPTWHKNENLLSYEMELDRNIKLTATAQLENDGVRFSYQISNHSNVSYRNLQAVTCVKLYSVFSDTFLERTYVHHPEGFDLLASETPQRLSMPLQNWLPCRYLVSYTWPVHDTRIEKDADSITRYYKSRKVDKPFIATLSHDKTWIAATFTKETGNLWTNPERSCQHADPAIDLKTGETKKLELKTFILKGKLDDLLKIVEEEIKK
jgi:hypothetical protein